MTTEECIHDDESANTLVPSITNKSEAIRALNDALRTTFVGGAVVLTSGVAALPPQTRAKIVRRLREFDDFNADNDPYDEHDFAAFEVDGETYFFKIDYYDRAMRMHSTDPANVEVTTRVLTIMRASEY
jgi:hypothetical protein